MTAERRPMTRAERNAVARSQPLGEVTTPQLSVVPTSLTEQPVDPPIAEPQVARKQKPAAAKKQAKADGGGGVASKRAAPAAPTSPQPVGSLEVVADTATVTTAAPPDTPTPPKSPSPAKTRIPKSTKAPRLENRITVYMTTEDYNAAKAAFLADLKDDRTKAGSFSDWIVSVLLQEASLTPQQRAAEALDVASGTSRGIVMDAESRLVLREAMRADWQVNRLVSESGWCASAIMKTVEAVRQRSGGVLPPAPARLPSTVFH